MFKGGKGCEEGDKIKFKSKKKKKKKSKKMSFSFNEVEEEVKRREDELKEEEEKCLKKIEKKDRIKLEEQQEIFEICFKRLNISLSKSEKKEDEILSLLLDFFLNEFEKNWGSWLIFLQTHHQFVYLSELNYNFGGGGMEVVLENAKAIKQLGRKTLARLVDLDSFISSRKEIERKNWLHLSWKQLNDYLAPRYFESMLGNNKPKTRLPVRFKNYVIEEEDEGIVDPTFFEGAMKTDSSSVWIEEIFNKEVIEDVGVPLWTESEWERFVKQPIKMLIKLLLKTLDEIN